jgi:hypothetical protein
MFFPILHIVNIAKNWNVPDANLRRWAKFSVIALVVESLILIFMLAFELAIRNSFKSEYRVSY